MSDAPGPITEPIDPENPPTVPPLEEEPEFGDGGENLEDDDEEA